ncbi:hypothetical protein HPB47_018720 [Ixodes persulcatus]|uniref:Uncharacterized protein n=1 Tax=Ixodes persulcatus TaxID=34615 RepID=A0AC60QJZ0_IXOPE|nr:hypothetical protein HPB47_018720 [Ixodes persulcatus]
MAQITRGATGREGSRGRHATAMLACDDSPSRMGAVLSQMGEGGTERPVAFAWRTLSQTERNYARTQLRTKRTVFVVAFCNQHGPMVGWKVVIVYERRPR